MPERIKFLAQVLRKIMEQAICTAWFLTRGGPGFAHLGNGRAVPVKDQMGEHNSVGSFHGAGLPPALNEIGQLTDAGHEIRTHVFGIHSPQVSMIESTEILHVLGFPGLGWPECVKVFASAFFQRSRRRISR